MLYYPLPLKTFVSFPCEFLNRFQKLKIRSWIKRLRIQATITRSLVNIWKGFENYFVWQVLFYAS